MPRLFALSLQMVLALATVAFAQPPWVIPIDGERFPAMLSAVDPQWQCAFVADGTRRALPAEHLVRWGNAAEPGRGPYLLLADGGLLVADVTSADKESLAVDSLLFGQIKMPLERVAGVVFQPPTDRARRDLLLDTIVSAPTQSDRLVLTNDDELSGTVRGIGEGKIRMDTAIGPVEVETLRVRAVSYNPALRRTDRPLGLHAWAGFTDGSLLIATSLSVEEKSLRVTTAGGQHWSGSPIDLACLQPIGGKVIYLTDIEASSYRHLPYLELAWPYKKDRNVLGARLRANGKTYLKGLGMHSAARLTYTLAEPFSRFAAELAIDDVAGSGGSVRYRVFVDERLRYTSPVVRGGQPPLPISVEVAGGKRLDLVVDYAERADQLDIADWLDARLVR